MKQILQSLKTGDTEVADVPVPSAVHGQLLIKTAHTLVSAGTERMLVEFGKAGWIDKARQQPDKVRLVLEKIKTDGLQPTIESVLNKLDKPLPLGYCNVGRIASLGDGVPGFQQGDRVVSNGKHAEVVSVPFNLCAKVPDSVTDEEAAFTVLGAIALQGIRLVRPTLGETIVVTGLGLVGLMTVQLLRANGCRVLGLDYDTNRLNLARQFGAEVVDLSAGQDPVKVAQAYSRDRGVDAVIVTASTKSDEPMHQAALMCRKRGRIVLVGVVGLELSRDDFFEKELTFQVSASYGPGRYDPNYEEKGQDYPVGFVRWTEQRNFEAVLDMMADDRLDVKPLISHRFDIEEADKAYQFVSGTEPTMGILLNYACGEIETLSNSLIFKEGPPDNANLSIPEKINTPASISFLGAGNYATAVLIPAFKSAGAHLRSVVSNAGVSGVYAGRKFGFDETTTESGRVFSDSSVDAVVIATQHNSHASLALQALKADKHVFVEKPLCLTLAELNEIESAYNLLTAKPMLMVGFNRRFSPLVVYMKELLSSVSEPKSIIFTVNAGAIPADHWTQDMAVGGGRIIGEVCHFIDLIRFVVGEQIVGWRRTTMECKNDDTVSIDLQFAEGSIGTIHYFANGPKSYPKERLEVFASGRVIQLDNFRKLTGFGWPSFKYKRLWRQNKGQFACAQSFVNAVERNIPAPIPAEEIFEVTRISIEIATGCNENY